MSATDLGGIAISEALSRAGVPPEDVDYVYMGQVLQAGAGQITARRAAVNAGIPMSVPATTINKVCLSGLNTIYLADQMIAAGEADVVVAGGARAGYRAGDKSVVDSMMYDGLFCAFDACAMGAGTEKYAASAGLERDAQDALSAESHARAAAAQKAGRLADEIVPVPVPQRRGEPVVVEHDEGIRPGTTAESLGALRPAFDAAGNITAGNASQISDGGSALIIMSEAAVEKYGVKPLGQVVGYGQVAGPDTSLLTQPSRSIMVAAERAGVDVADIGLYELNEAFAAVALASMTDLGVSDDIVNVNGGAIALGHPIGASGNRLALSLLMQMQRDDVELGAAALCGGGGQGDALLVRRVS
ncbi:UNVERIFIED_CONTAM: hypothetical protein GTU68_032865 [Idotea baltica]|nr:hypothetical protein [Idotea baltica]